MPSKVYCPLCHDKEVSHFYFQKHLERDFFQCSTCDLIFVDREQLISLTKEKNRYDLHDNDIQSDGYKGFLNRLVLSVEKFISNKEMIGLDFGEGCYPLLRELFDDIGIKNMDGFDPFYNNNTNIFNSKYDFITCSEVLEHINNPFDDISRLISLLNLKGILGVSTALYGGHIKFENWYYIKDITHINIFTEKTVYYLANTFNCDLKLMEKDLFIFEKK
jgi:hypothetical protein